MDSRIKILGNRPSYLNHVLHELRDEVIQLDRMKFRHNLERAGEILAYEMSKTLEYSSKTVRTPLGELEMELMDEHPVIISILRAGIPLHLGILKIFDQSDNGFISAYRHHTKGNEFIVKIEYLAVPEITKKTLIVVDPMIATGKSIVLSYESLLEMGKPERIIIAAVIASEEGLNYVLRHIPNAEIYVGAVDNELTAKSYIVPGLGDAGDLAFGEK